ncbi:MAG: methionine synthase, partial [Actinobacteria bacterium]|nr:methionine synthase [Actinomycetota bacterium]
HASKIVPMHKIPDDQRLAALDLIYDRRRYNEDGSLEFDPLQHILELFDGVSAGGSADDRAAMLAALPLEERLKTRVIDGERSGLEGDLDQALETRAALSIVNDVLLDAMRTVGELFGSGQMQLPFVLQSAEVMKAAVAYLEPHMERSSNDGKGTIVLATVKGDVHDIGKNLVDIILTNNGYSVVNLGIKQPVSAILDAAQTHGADAIGMSGLLVKSTVVMRENLEEMNLRNVSDRWPVMLGGAALTRAFVEQDLASMFNGEVRYAKDAFEGLALMDTVMAIKRGEPGAELPPLRQRRVRTQPQNPILANEATVDRASDVSRDEPVPTPPFWGSRVVRGIALADYASYLDERATFMGQWGLKGSRTAEGPSYEDLVETEGRPRLRYWLDRIHTEGLVEAAVVYGYFRCNSQGNDLVIWDDEGKERARFDFPRQNRDRHLCLADFFRPIESGTFDVVSFQFVTMGQRVADAANELFAKDAYRDYLELHGLSVQLTEALAEMWHARVRSELGIDQADGDLDALFKQGYQGSRYSFGYPACPNVEDQAQLVTLLDPARIGIELSDEFQLHPEQSTSAIVVHHREAKYFNAT